MERKDTDMSALAKVIREQIEQPSLPRGRLCLISKSWADSFLQYAEVFTQIKANFL